MSVLRYKIWHDLWANKSRTLQVLLIIGISTAAIGMILTTRQIVIERLAGAWQTSSPAMIWLRTFSPVDAKTLSSLRRIPGIEDVEGFAMMSVEWRIDEGDEWSFADLIVRDDYEDLKFNQLTLLDGEWPHRNYFAVGPRGGEIGIFLGGRVYIRLNGEEVDKLITGVIADVGNKPSMGSDLLFYTTRDEMEELIGNRDFNYIMAGAKVYDEKNLKSLATQIQDKLERQGIDSAGSTPNEGPSSGSRIADPNKHYSQELADGVFFILGAIAFFALILGVFLVYNTITALISKQVAQIGVMKAIGANTWQILRHYIMAVSVYGLLASGIAIPLGILGGWILSDIILQSFYIEPAPFTPSLSAILIQILILILMPLLASLGPILSGARITVREAIKSYGLSTSVGFIEQWLSKLEGFSRLWLLTISNTFRHKGRVILTQITLVISGLIFMTVLGVRDSTIYTFKDVLFSIVRFNINFQFESPERINKIEKITNTHPGVETVEMWALCNGSLRPMGEAETADDANAVFAGIPLPTKLYGPQIRTGRWLLPEDGKSIVINQVLAAEVGVDVGDWITFDRGAAGESDWKVVGLSFDPIMANSVYAPRTCLLKDIHSVGKANTIWIQTAQTDASSEARIANDLREYYERRHLDVSLRAPFGADTASEITGRVLNEFSIIFILLAAMAVIIGMVGCIALNGILSINVLERTREIGVMRAIGAKPATIIGLLRREALLLGWLSWLIALPLSIPASWIMTLILGKMLNMGLVYHYSYQGPMSWLLIISLLSITTSWFPARSIVRISVRESLAYE